MEFSIIIVFEYYASNRCLLMLVLLLVSNISILTCTNRAYKFDINVIRRVETYVKAMLEAVRLTRSVIIPVTSD